MTWISALAWIAGLWLAAGIEAAWGGGMPGPLLLVALAAGLWSGPRAGMIIGAGAGVCDAVLFGGNFMLLGFIGSAGGGAAGLLTPWLSKRHLLVGLAAALVFSFLIGLLLGWPHHRHLAGTVLSALGRGGENSLWMIPIYGIVLLAFRGEHTSLRGE
ncbi:MAG: hypothetical protein ACYDCO_09585 [Armatimonadota bacterium]